MITTVTLNPAIDQTIIVNQYKPGQIHQVQIRRMDVGGKGINVSKVIRLFNEKTTAIGYLGKQNQKIFKQFFHENKIKYDFVLINDKTRTNTKIIDLSRRETTEFNELGFCISQEEIQALKEKIRIYSKKSKYVVFSGSMHKGKNGILFEEYLNEVNDSKKLVIDVTGEMLLQGVKKHPFLIKPNIHELKSTFGLSVSSEKEMIQEALNIQQKYQIQWILLSMGSEGALLLSQDQVLKAEAIPVEVKSTVGAGDSMLGGFLYGYEHFKDPIEAFRYAIACGTMAVTMEGTEIFTKQEMLKILPKVQMQDVSSYYR